MREFIHLFMNDSNMFLATLITLGFIAVIVTIVLVTYKGVKKE